jgi:murein DD-endopeptidase MepM/ murein hydrolase activator NlpD
MPQVVLVSEVVVGTATAMLEPSTAGVPNSTVSAQKTQQSITPTPIPPMPLPTPPSPLVDLYQVEPGDTLGGISWAYDISIDELVALNNLGSEAAIIQVGQTLHVPLRVSRSGPVIKLLPDSEVVYSPAYLEFDEVAFVAAQGGYLASYSQRVNGVQLSGAEIIRRVSQQFSVGPRVLLAALEFYGGWVTQPQPSELTQPLGRANPYGDNLFLQLSWTAHRLNAGYYDYKRSGSIAIRFRDGNRAIIPPGMNAGTVALQNLLAVHTTWDTWLTQLQPDGFLKTYQTLFGDPAALAYAPVVPYNLTQPAMRLPWQPGQTFYLTGGPHAAYGDGTAWAAIDFGPPDVLGSCLYSQQPVTAAAAGVVILDRKGIMFLDLDGDGKLQTGWSLLYLHTVAIDGLTTGQVVAAGTPLGYASCEGGLSNSSHLHFARRYNGEWMAADGPVPLVLSGWQVKAGFGQYEGQMIRDGAIKTACECWDEAQNALLGE